MTILSDLILTGTDFLRLPPEGLSEFILQTATSKKTVDGLFFAPDLLVKSNGLTGAALESIPVYGDVPETAVAERVEQVLMHLVNTGRIVPAFTAGGSVGTFRIIAGR